MGHLEENAAHGPHVDSSAVNFLPQENFGSTVPKSHYFMCIRFERETEGTG
jgi:hypothetical protein